MNKLYIYEYSKRYDGKVFFEYAQVEVEETNKLYKVEKSMPFIYVRQVKKDDIGKIKVGYNTYNVVLTERNDELAKEIISTALKKTIIYTKKKLDDLNDLYEMFMNTTPVLSERR